MDEPRTHYQLSFTSRQALLLFVGLLVALGVAYTLGVLTGLAGGGRDREPGREEARAAAASAAPTPEATAASSAPAPSATAGPALEFPKPVRGVSPRALSAPAAGRAPGSVTRLGEGAAGAGGAAAGTSAAAAPSPGPTPSPGLQMFEDEGGPPARPTASRAAPPRRPTAAPPSSSSFWVQALSVSSEKEARTRRDRLAAHGFGAAVVPGEAPGGARVYRVRVGPFKTREDADRAAARLRSQEKLQPWVVPPGK